MDNLEQEPVPGEENGDKEKDHGPWPVKRGPNQEPIGLPKGVNRRDVILRLNNKGGWEAVNPSPEDIEEQSQWRGGNAARRKRGEPGNK
ncbi:MAG: hypothetical protein COS97_01060 [Candidatus Nealsonbacteria bacterium CG07_land_8_20_14_0_80_40_10]|nr:MAG: hypothetical protein COU44_01780 [Candidatus Nealsonbacteria bacterium CG10_big_fil_rev_8_21_14_0_10_40_24]PIU43426.1 MAG: hypothetical protein COS97_01060 [Candidatus Nealsonbacteria bacterium CG07_land_8_20_14_0_80_40_10]